MLDMIKPLSQLATLKAFKLDAHFITNKYFRHDSLEITFLGALVSVTLGNIN